MKNLEKSLEATKHLLSLYDSPFPDKQELKKREMLRKEIERLERQIEELKK